MSVDNIEKLINIVKASYYNKFAIKMLLIFKMSFWVQS